jgi:hypothetical protein
MTRTSGKHKGLFRPGDVFNLKASPTWRNVVELNKLGAGLSIAACKSEKQLFLSLSQKYSEDKVSGMLSKVKIPKRFKCYYHRYYPRRLYGNFSDINSYLHSYRKKQRKEYDLNPNMGWMFVYTDDDRPVGRSAVINGNRCAMFSAPFGVNFMSIASQLAQAWEGAVKMVDDRSMGGRAAMLYKPNYELYNPAYPRYANYCSLCFMMAGPDYCDDCNYLVDQAWKAEPAGGCKITAK